MKLKELTDKQEKLIEVCTEKNIPFLVLPKYEGCDYKSFDPAILLKYVIIWREV